MPKQIDTNRETLIAALKAEVERQEQTGQFSTVHHDMLNALLKGDKPADKTEVKQEINTNG